MDASVRGLPLLSGPVPPREDPSRNNCRRCQKEFNFFTKSGKQCNHCGYTYCSTCIDHQALMPRTGTAETGYEVVQVCAYCIENLTITACGKSFLRSLPVSKLRNYLKAYGISVPPSTIEKDELVQLIVGSRGDNGCLPAVNEEYYRKHSIPRPNTQNERPRRNLFDRFGDVARQATGQTSGASTSNPSPPRPPPNIPRQSRPVPSPNPQYTPRPSPGFQHPPYTPRQYNYQPPPPPPQPQRPPQNTYAYPHRQAGTNQPQPPRPQAPPRPPSPPIPALTDLLLCTPQELSSLSIHVLKEILHQNHVNARLIIEKGDLVDKVKILVEAERREREREEEIRALEEQEVLERQRRNMEEFRARQPSPNPTTNDSSERPAASGEEHNSGGEDTTNEPKSAPVPPSPPPPPKASFSTLDRQGLCIVCQDEEANIALVDCGHLALCMHCSDLVMNTTRECPLCRTRIVTKDRMLRVFKT